MKLGEKEKKIIYIVVSVAIVLCAFLLGYRNIDKKTKSLETEVKELDTKHKNYLTMKNNLPKYEKGIEEGDAEYLNILGDFNTGYTQEYALSFLKEVENASGAWISQAGFAQLEEVYSFGHVASSNPFYPSMAGYSTDNKGYKTVISTAFEGTYDSFKNLVDYINNYKFKCTIDSITAQNNRDTGIISGTMVISLYSIQGSDRDFTNVSFPYGMYGTKNIFDSKVFFPGANLQIKNGDNILSDNDFVISVQNASTGKAITVGPSNDTAGSQSVISEENAEKDVTIRVFQDKDKNYCVQYSIGDDKFPVVNYDDGMRFTPGNLLSILVVGSKRTDDSDLAAAKIKIINQTDMQVEVKKVNDDVKKPRCKIVATKGKVVEYK